MRHENDVESDEIAAFPRSIDEDLINALRVARSLPSNDRNRCLEDWGGRILPLGLNHLTIHRLCQFQFSLPDGFVD